MHRSQSPSTTRVANLRLRARALAARRLQPVRLAVSGIALLWLGFGCSDETSTSVPPDAKTNNQDSTPGGSDTTPNTTDMGGPGDDAGTADGGTTALDPAICAPTAGPFSLEIDNPFYLLKVGSVRVLEGQKDGVTERVEISVLDETREVAGVTTRVVQEYETEDGQLIEISRNFFAQAPDGTVCYFGEDVDIYEMGKIVSHDGQWYTGVDGALSGIVMPAMPAVGQTYPQEVAPGLAEDRARHVSMGDKTVVPAGEFTDTLTVLEDTPLEPGSVSTKVYARGEGLIVDDVLKLISHTGK